MLPLPCVFSLRLRFELSGCRWVSVLWFLEAILVLGLYSTSSNGHSVLDLFFTLKDVEVVGDRIRSVGTSWWIDDLRQTP